jgi:hypothetical protein
VRIEIPVPGGHLEIREYGGSFDCHYVGRITREMAIELLDSVPETDRARYLIDGMRPREFLESL